MDSTRNIETKANVCRAIPKRITHIDNAKAIGMILIIASHIWITESFSNSMVFSLWNAIINSFYVPLFFLLSGVFESQQSDLTKALKRLWKLLRYIIIFAIFGFVSSGLYFGKWELQSCLRATTVWFLITLFWITAIFTLIKLFKWTWCKVLFICLLSFVGYSFAKTEHSILYLGQACLCIPFYALGFYLKNQFKDTTFNQWLWLGMCLLWTITFYWGYEAPQNLSLNLVSQNYFTFYILALSGSIVIIELSKLINWNVLSWFGRNTIIPMLVQMLIIWILARICVANTMLSYFSMAIIACILCGLCIPLFNNNYYTLFK